MRKSLEENLISGEAIVYRGHTHWIVLFRPVVVALLLSALGALLLYAGLAAKQGGAAWLVWPGIAALCAAAAVLLRGTWRRRAIEFAVTNKRMMIRRGLLEKRTEEILLPKIESIAADQGVLGRLFNYGTLTVRGTGGTFEPLPYVAGAGEFRRQVLEQIAGTR